MSLKQVRGINGKVLCIRSTCNTVKYEQDPYWQVQGSRRPSPSADSEAAEEKLPR